MGLTVGLYKFNDTGDISTKNESYMAASDRLYEEFYRGVDVETHRELTPEQQEELASRLKELQESYGVNEWGDPVDDAFTVILEDSQKHPDHLFKIGYWVSSNTQVGFNRVVEMLCGKPLGGIIEEAGGNGYYIEPDWKMARARACIALGDMLERIPEVGNYQVMDISYNPFKDPDTDKTDCPKAALEIFLSEMEVDRGTNWSNHRGTFYPQGIKVHGLVEGVTPTLKGPVPTTYVVYQEETENPEDGPYDWYVQAMEIVLETIDFVLAQEDPSKFVLGWSE